VAILPADPILGPGAPPWVMVDFSVENHGTMSLLRALSDDARQWLADNIPGAECFGDAVIIDQRYIDDVVEQIRLEGLEVG